LYEAAYIVIPESFETRGGRPAAQCVLDLDVERDFLRHRVVQFASDYYNNTYLLEMFTERGSYINNSSVWENTVDSFSVEGEPLSRSPDALWLMGAIGLVAASAVIPLGLWVRRPRRPHSAVATAEGDEETAPQEEAPGVLPGARRGP
jgi:hypothetical protein